MASTNAKQRIEILCAEYERLDESLAELVTERNNAIKVLADARLNVRVCKEMMRAIEEEIAVASSALDT